MFNPYHILSDLDDITTHVMYLQDGRVHFFKKMKMLQEETGETRLGKAIARIMKHEKTDAENRRLYQFK